MKGAKYTMARKPNNPNAYRNEKFFRKLYGGRRPFKEVKDLSYHLEQHTLRGGSYSVRLRHPLTSARCDCKNIMILDSNEIDAEFIKNCLSKTKLSWRDPSTGKMLDKDQSIDAICKFLGNAKVAEFVEVEFVSKFDAKVEYQIKPGFLPITLHGTKTAAYYPLYIVGVNMKLERKAALTAMYKTINRIHKRMRKIKAEMIKLNKIISE